MNGKLAEAFHSVAKGSFMLSLVGHGFHYIIKALEEITDAIYFLKGDSQ